jgi:alpha/beta superfamily hydrolase
MKSRPSESPATIAPAQTSGFPTGSTLDGLWLPARGEDEPRGAAVVAAPHPLMGGAMDSSVATEIALAASDSGYGALRFNWRGVGASAGTPSGEPEDATADYRAALAFAEESSDSSILLAGYSWGALAASRVCGESARARKMVLVAPPVGMLEEAVLAAWGHPVLVLAGGEDEYAPIDDLRKKIALIPAAELTVIEGANHFFTSGLDELGCSIRSWLEA